MTEVVFVRAHDADILYAIGVLTTKNAQLHPDVDAHHILPDQCSAGRVAEYAVSRAVVSGAGSFGLERNVSERYANLLSVAREDTRVVLHAANLHMTRQGVPVDMRQNLLLNTKKLGYYFGSLPQTMLVPEPYVTTPMTEDTRYFVSTRCKNAFEITTGKGGIEKIFFTPEILSVLDVVRTSQTGCPAIGEHVLIHGETKSLYGLYWDYFARQYVDDCFPRLRLARDTSDII